jgi:UDP-N-acetylmuramate dehydrogenase
MTNPFKQLGSIVTTDKELAPLTSLKIGGLARYFIEPDDIEQLAATIRIAAEHDVAIRVLGGGTNLLIAAERLDCAVLSLNRISFVERNRNNIRAGAGAKMPQLIKQSVQWGLSGLEGLSGIPGTAGGFAASNAGGKWGDVADVIDSVTLVHSNGDIEQRAASQLEFGYRHANLGDGIVAAVTFALAPGDADEMTNRCRSILNKKSNEQPLNQRSPGCVFKNPPGGSAGKLIDDAGLKNLSVGDARVSDHHANFIVNTGTATAEEMIRLIELVHDEVDKRSGINLKLELKVWS